MWSDVFSYVGFVSHNSSSSSSEEPTMQKERGEVVEQIFKESLKATIEIEHVGSGFLDYWLVVIDHLDYKTRAQCRQVSTLFRKSVDLRIIESCISSKNATAEECLQLSFRLPKNTPQSKKEQFFDSLMQLYTSKSAKIEKEKVHVLIEQMSEEQIPLQLCGGFFSHVAANVFNEQYDESIASCYSQKANKSHAICSMQGNNEALALLEDQILENMHQAARGKLFILLGDIYTTRNISDKDPKEYYNKAKNALCNSFSSREKGSVMAFIQLCDEEVRKKIGIDKTYINEVLQDKIRGAQAGHTHCQKWLLGICKQDYWEMQDYTKEQLAYYNETRDKVLLIAMQFISFHDTIHGFRTYHNNYKAIRSFITCKLNSILGDGIVSDIFVYSSGYHDRFFIFLKKNLRDLHSQDPHVRIILSLFHEEYTIKPLPTVYKNVLVILPSDWNNFKSLFEPNYGPN